LTVKILTQPLVSATASSGEWHTHAVDLPSVGLRWVLWLRWSALAGQALAMVVVHVGLGISLPLGWLGAILAVATCTNVLALSAARRAQPREGWLVSLMVVDVLALTATLYLTGGPSNPFSFLYLVPIALATLVLRPGWTWMLVLLSLAGSAFLFVAHRPLRELEMHEAHMKTHLRGMWVAFGVAAAFIVYFLVRVRRALAARDEALAQSRAAIDRQHRLGSLATLAAGAAHELATPLGTIAVVARELVHRLGALDLREKEDAQLIRSEVDRCRSILLQMSYSTKWTDHGAGGTPASPEPAPAWVSLGTLVASARATLREPARLTVVGEPAGYEVDEAFSQALASVLRNAEDASGEDRRIWLTLGSAGSFGRPRSSQGDGGKLRPAHPARLRLVIEDEGVGMSASALARVGEPFFTTKSPGEGMGLGLFLARAVVERLGGSLSVDSEEGRGTKVVFEVPVRSSGESAQRQTSPAVAASAAAVVSHVPAAREAPGGNGGRS
jgi:two-component system sensor histidine kinase RegB